MTAQYARLAQGTLIYMANDGAGAGKLLIGEITSVSGPTMSSDLLDATTQESSGGFREKIIGLTDPGEISFDILFNQTLPSHDATNGLLGVFKNKLIKYFQLELPDSMGVWQLQASVNGFELDASVDGILTASVTLAVSGLPDFDATIWS